MAKLPCPQRLPFGRSAKLRWVFFALVLACMGYIKFEYFRLLETPVFVALYFTVSAIAFAGLIPFFVNLRRSRFTWFNGFVKNISKISYSLYLGHVVAFVACIAAFHGLGLYDVIYPNPWLTYPIFLTAVFLLATTTYFLIEKPFLALRDRGSRTAGTQVTVASASI